jgi:transposase-like protein
MKQPRQHYDAARKVEILREHLENSISISELSQKYDIHPNQIHQWKKQLFEGALETFSHKHNRKNNRQDQKITKLEHTLRERDNLIVDIMTDNVRLKKS